MTPDNGHLSLKRRLSYRPRHIYRARVFCPGDKKRTCAALDALDVLVIKDYSLRKGDSPCSS